ncbi:hypothetical protein F1559_003805 [Cyanidiococcus yangmingshanensis]|uniref:Uncharacterized protein n=1 Tax=Cyanidiococcus yangmingshanensis TaxID=2690220 RepID=A0A7J7ILA8_9RHOD|nr:hypothetical protein F1559_003805 [Cyanidiococcus yangmingshanensis]
MDRAEARAPHPIFYVILAVTDQDLRAARLADVAASDDSLDPALLWLLYTAKENSSRSLNAYVCSQPALAPKTGLCLWRVAASCGMDSAALLAALVQKVMKSTDAIALSAIREWFFETMQHPDAVVRRGFSGVWGEALLARGGCAESERGYILEWIEDLLSEIDEGDAARAESRRLLVFVRRVLEYCQALWNDRELAAAGVAATLGANFATSCPAKLAGHSEENELLHAKRRPTSDSMVEGERLADQYVAQQTLDWLANQTPPVRQQWRVHLEAIFALANAPVSFALPEPPQPVAEHADRTPEPETNLANAPVSFALPEPPQPVAEHADRTPEPETKLITASAPGTDEASNAITDSIVKSVLDGDIWQAGWQCLQRQGWSSHACTPENALALVQRHLEASVSATNPVGHVSDASRSATMRALALLCEWRAALDMMGD